VCFWNSGWRGWPPCCRSLIQCITHFVNKLVCGILFGGLKALFLLSEQRAGRTQDHLRKYGASSRRGVLLNLKQHWQVTRRFSEQTSTWRTGSIATIYIATILHSSIVNARAFASRHYVVKVVQYVHKNKFSEANVEYYGKYVGWVADDETQNCLHGLGVGVS